MTKIKWSEMSLGQKVVYGLGLLVVLAILGPLAAMAAMTVTNIFVAAIYALGLFTIFILFPSINRFLRTMALKLMKATARMNPIETLELDYQKKRESLNRFTSFVKQMIAAHKVSQDELEALKKEFPDRDLSDRQAMMDKMKAAVQVLRTKASEADTKLGKYETEIRFIKADNAWAKRAGGAMAQMRNVEGVDALDELLKGEAIGQVRQNVAEAFAELDMLLEQDDTVEVLKITHQQDPNTTGELLKVPHFFEVAKA